MKTQETNPDHPFAMPRLIRQWVTWPHDVCEDCGGNAEIYTEEREGFASDGDIARCVECGATGNICCDTESPAVIMWHDEKESTSHAGNALLCRCCGPATPDAPEREWACNRCMYSWDGNGGWCPSCGEQATHGRAFAPDAVKKSKLMEKLRIIQSGKTAIMPSGEIVGRGTAGSADYDSANRELPGNNSI